MVYSYNRILFNNKKEDNFLTRAVTWMEPWKLYVKWKKWLTKDHISYNSTYMNDQDRETDWDRKQMQVA